MSEKFLSHYTYEINGDVMPYGDGTGPEGMGPKTGKALGFCAGFNSPGFTKGVPRGKSGRGRVRGRRRGNKTDVNPRGISRPRDGRGRGFTVQRTQATVNNEVSKEDELENLKNYAEDLKKELEAVENRMNELSNSD